MYACEKSLVMSNEAHRTALLTRAHAGDREAEASLVEENAGLVHALVRRFLGRGADPEELTQIGMIGLYKAIRAFNPDYGVQFSTYAVPKIEGEIRRYLRDGGMIKVSRSIYERAGKLSRGRKELSLTLGRDPHLSELSEYLGLSPDEISECETAFAGVDSLEREIGTDGTPLSDLVSTADSEDFIDKIALRELIHTLPQREMEVILLLYYRDMTQTQAAKLLGISQVQVSRIQKKALDHLRELAADQQFL